jgi:CheY-like chemotaxis protein
METLPERNRLTILMADDDEDDRLMTKQAMEKNHLVNEIFFVKDGEELMDFLLKQNAYNKDTAPTPDIILLDLNMPRKSGQEALKEIKSNAALKAIPVIVLTTSEAEEDILKTYKLGVNSFITKPVTFEGLVKVVKQLDDYWFELVKLPRTKKD